MANHLHRPGAARPPQTISILDVPADLFEKYLVATGKAFAGIGAAPQQADIQARLLKAAADVGVTGDHAAHLAMRYSLFVSIIKEHQEALLEHGLMSGEAGPGKSTVFEIPFLAAVSRIPARIVKGQPVCDMTVFWALCDACAVAGKPPA
ncbi:MAG: hypothetical protein M0R22_00545 [Dehalococcoidia bacterium]|jgi:hypothetical protein|nr:hypothetical protein [Dehalococcoidia bacterium]